MTLSVGLKERRQGHRDPGINAAVRIGIRVFGDRSGACHDRWRSTAVMPESKCRSQKWSNVD